MTDIQQARDMLAKWRGAARDGEWSIEADTAESSWLGRGTAGNPELLDAIDFALDLGIRFPGYDEAADAMSERIAAAIISADERMSA